MQRGERAYVIGDVHGCYDLLKALMTRIEAHNAERPEVPTHVVILGDLIDRGPDSAKVLRHLYEAQQQNDNIIILQGNHEDLMVRALANEPGMLKAWLRIGGRETLRSFGLQPADSDTPSHEIVEAARSAISTRLTTWLASLPLFARSGDYYFCHAGVRPGVPLRRQVRGDLLWIREPFLSAADYHGAVIVHGHSVETEVQTRDNRIGIDTGAYRTGILTAVYLEGGDREFITVSEADLVKEAGVRL